TQILIPGQQAGSVVPRNAIKRIRPQGSDLTPAYAIVGAADHVTAIAYGQKGRRRESVARAVRGIEPDDPVQIVGEWGGPIHPIGAVSAGRDVTSFSHGDKCARAVGH